MRLTYDDEADAVYVYIREKTVVASSEKLDEGRVADLDDQGELVGVEILDASSRGVLLTDLAERFDLGDLLPHLRNLEARFRPVERT